jgi:phosphoadenosine phosphosulfate reductase
MITTNKFTQLHQEQLKFTSFVTSPFNAESDFSAINRQFEDKPVDDLLAWALSMFGDKVAQVTSFGPTGLVILDHLARLSPGIRIITLDTEFLFDETYALWEEIQRRYPVQLDIRRPALSPEAQAKKYGSKLWQVSANWCCYLRKVLPLDEALQGLEGWITGLRRDQATTRNQLSLVAWDAKYDLVKISPLASWARGQVWSYILDHKIPYNTLHDQGYASIGCSHCTRPTSNADDERSGRWHGQQKTECGIHVLSFQ